MHLFISQYAKARFPLGDKWQYLTISSGRYHPVRRGVFRTLLNVYDEAFNRVLFRRSFARDFWEGPEYATDISQCLPPLCLCIKNWIISFTSVSQKIIYFCKLKVRFLERAETSFSDFSKTINRGVFTTLSNNEDRALLCENI